jgi:hypothetical protein
LNLRWHDVFTLGVKTMPFMKQLFLILTLVAAGAVTNAQTHVQLGLKGGLNVSNTMAENFDYNPRVSFHAGGLAHIHLNKQWALQPELVFSAQGSKYSNNGNDYITKLDYLNLPFLVQFMTASGFRVETGPQLGVLLKARSKVNDGINNNINDGFKPVDFSWVIGAGFLFPSGFGLDARYNAGISKINENGSANLRNSVFQFGIFYQFPHLDTKK